MTINFNNLNSPKMQRLIAAAGVETEEDAGKNIDALEHNWNCPQCFDKKQLDELNLAISDGMEDIEKRFSNFFHSDFQITASSSVQHFANSIVERNSNSEQVNYFLGFGDKETEVCGFIEIPINTAINLLEKLLGESEGEDVDNKSDRLSELEESLLIDVASVMVHVITCIDEKISLIPANEVIFKELPMEFEGLEELFEIPLEIKGAESEDTFEAKAIILCNSLAAIINTETESQELSAEEISNAILEHLQETNVEVTTKFASVQLTLDEVMDLKAGDIMLLDKKVDEPVEIMLDNKSVFKAQCASDNGEYALVITEKCDTL